MTTSDTIAKNISNNEDDSATGILVSMGFAIDHVRTALLLSNGNIDMAANLLLSGEIMDGTDVSFPHAPNDTVRIRNNDGDDSRSHSDNNINHEFRGRGISKVQTIQGTISQYSIGTSHHPDGRSACTCIALYAAEKILLSMSSLSLFPYDDVRNCATEDGISRSNNVPMISSEFLNQIIVEGVTIYATYQQQCQNQLLKSNERDMTATEHTSVEDVLNVIGPSMFPTLVSAVKHNNYPLRQGILSQDRNHPLNLLTQLRDLYESWLASASTITYTNQENRQQSMCIILTKPPESILLVFPPQSPHSLANRATTTTATIILPITEADEKKEKTNYTHNRLLEMQHKFLIIDSHPRPNLFQTEQVYCRVHDTIEDLYEQSLQHLFPMMDLGPDVPELMTMMYNSFELYPFING
jgi:UBA/TS-N domain